jgi:FkbM family methyltransferase
MTNLKPIGLLLPVMYYDFLNENKLCLYGYGFLGKWIYNIFKTEFGYSLPVFDREPKITENGLARPLNELYGYQGIVILSCRHHIKQVSDVLDQMDVRWISADHLFLEILAAKREQILATFSHDDFSIKTYLSIERILRSGTMCEHDHLVSNQYFDPPQFRPNFSDYFVDAGAFCGDTLERFVQENLGTFGHYFGFEPGSRQFTALNNRTDRLIKEWGLDSSKLTLSKLGLGAQKTRIVFNETSTDSMSHSFDISQNSFEGIQVVSLDGFLEGSPATFLKSDIEGMDFDFLLGASNSIISNRPKMALSCYHYPTDLINMINYISGFSLDYKFKLRHHANVIGDYVLYAY